MKLYLVFVATFLAITTCPVEARRVVPIDGTHSRDEIKRICKEQNGEYRGNLDGYQCFKACPGGTCIVSCDANGRCHGDVPKGNASSPMPGKATPKAILRFVK